MPMYWNPLQRVGFRRLRVLEGRDWNRKCGLHGKWFAACGRQELVCAGLVNLTRSQPKNCNRLSWSHNLWLHETSYNIHNFRHKQRYFARCTEFTGFSFLQSRIFWISCVPTTWFSRISSKMAMISEDVTAVIIPFLCKFAACPIHAFFDNIHALASPISAFLSSINAFSSPISAFSSSISAFSSSISAFHPQSARFLWSLYLDSYSLPSF